MYQVDKMEPSDSGTRLVLSKLRGQAKSKEKLVLWVRYAKHLDNDEFNASKGDGVNKVKFRVVKRRSPLTAEEVDRVIDEASGDVQAVYTKIRNGTYTPPFQVSGVGLMTRSYVVKDKYGSSLGSYGMDGSRVPIKFSTQAKAEDFLKKANAAASDFKPYGNVGQEKAIGEGTATGYRHRAHESIKEARKLEERILCEAKKTVKVSKNLYGSTVLRLGKYTIIIGSQKDGSSVTMRGGGKAAQFADVHRRHFLWARGMGARDISGQMKIGHDEAVKLAYAHLSGKSAKKSESADRKTDAELLIRFNGIAEKYINARRESTATGFLHRAHESIGKARRLEERILSEAGGGRKRGQVGHFTVKRIGSVYRVVLDDKDESKVSGDTGVVALLKQKFDYFSDAHDAGQKVFRNATVSS